MLAQLQLHASQDRGRPRRPRSRGGRGPARAAAEEPWAASPHLQLALVDEQQEALPAALVSVRSALDRDPGDWRSWLVAARLEAESGHVAAARRALARPHAASTRARPRCAPWLKNRFRAWPERRVTIGRFVAAASTVTPDPPRMTDVSSAADIPVERVEPGLVGGRARAAGRARRRFWRDSARRRYLVAADAATASRSPPASSARERASRVHVPARDAPLARPREALRALRPRPPARSGT